MCKPVVGFFAWCSVSLSCFYVPFLPVLTRAAPPIIALLFASRTCINCCIIDGVDFGRYSTSQAHHLISGFNLNSSYSSRLKKLISDSFSKPTSFNVTASSSNIQVSSFSKLMIKFTVLEPCAFVYSLSVSSSALRYGFQAASL